jgi:hypothetical protein
LPLAANAPAGGALERDCMVEVVFLQTVMGGHRRWIGNQIWWNVGRIGQKISYVRHQRPRWKSILQRIIKEASI